MRPEDVEDTAPIVGSGFWIDKISVSNLRHIYRSGSDTAMLPALCNAIDAIEDAKTLIEALRKGPQPCPNTGDLFGGGEV